MMHWVSIKIKCGVAQQIKRKINRQLFPVCYSYWVGLLFLDLQYISVDRARLTIPCHLPGEAAGLALGLVMLGSKSAQAIEDMVGYAQETQHEKILRGLAVGIALVMYGRMEEADALIESLCRDKVSLKCHYTP